MAPERGSWPEHHPTLTDGVVVLRAFRPGDADEVFRACQDPDIQHFTQVPVPYLQGHAEEWVVGNAVLWADGVTANFAVVDAGSAEFLGDVGVIGVDHVARHAGVGYWTAPWARGRGLTSRAVRLACDWALSDGGLTRLQAEVEPVNPASAAVVESAGFGRSSGPMLEAELKGSRRSWVVWERHGGVPEEPR